MSDIADYIDSKVGAQQSILRYFHYLFSEDLGLQNNIKYKIPFYYHHGRLCYLNPIKNEGIELVFIRGQALSNEQLLLKGKDRKHVAGIEIYSLEEGLLLRITEVIHEALLLNEMHQKG